MRKSKIGKGPKEGHFFYRIDAEDGPGGLLRQGCEGQRAGPYRSLNTRIQSEKKSLRSLRLSGKKLRIIGLFFTAEPPSLKLQRPRARSLLR